MKASLSILAWAGAAAASIYKLAASAPASAGVPLLDAFVSYSIEFASFPDFAGNKSAPNAFSNALLSNLGSLMGTKPYIRVGGNTQDYALYNASLPWAIKGIINPSRAVDYPTTVYIGPSFFEGYAVLPGVRFSHGFNFALATTPAGWQTLLDTVPLVCQALAPRASRNGTASRPLYTWEYGNEPDLLSTSAQGPTRPHQWNESTYVAQWLNGTRQIRQLVQKHCPELMYDSRGHNQNDTSSTLPDFSGFIAPSFAGVNNHLKAKATWDSGLDTDGTVALFSSHNYISGATSPGVTLQGTLMNHSQTVHSVDAHIAEYASIFDESNSANRTAPRHILGETNSLYNEGKPGLSNAFGAALWGVDFLMYCASTGLGRVHMHQGTSYRYAAWQPIQTANATRGTKPPYYGSIAVAAALGNTGRHGVSVDALHLNGESSDVDSAYAIYVDGRIARVLVLNLRSYNTTFGGSGLGENTSESISARPSHNYTFTIPHTGHYNRFGRTFHGRKKARNSSGSVLVQRLLASGSDAITGITWDGWSYNIELDGGKPVRLANVTTEEHLMMYDGQVAVDVPDSSAALLHF